LGDPPYMKPRKRKSKVHKKKYSRGKRPKKQIRNQKNGEHLRGPVAKTHRQKVQGKNFKRTNESGS